MNRILRWGILSTAKIAVKTVIPAIKNSSCCEVVATASRNGDRARSTAEALGIPSAYGSYDDLLADPAIDAVCLPTF